LTRMDTSTWLAPITRPGVIVFVAYSITTPAA
jgi:hypothetical protein